MAKQAETAIPTWYAPFAARIEAHTALTGPMPTAQMLAVAAAFCKNAPGKQAMFTAMALRPTGCTVPQHTSAAGSGPARNHQGDIAKAGWVTPVVSGGARFLKLTAAGAAYVKARGVTGDLRTLLAPTVKAPKADKVTVAPKAKRVSRKANAKPAPVDQPPVEVEAPAPVAPVADQPTA